MKKRPKNTVTKKTTRMDECWVSAHRKMHRKIRDTMRIHLLAAPGHMGGMRGRVFDLMREGQTVAEFRDAARRRFGVDVHGTGWSPSKVLLASMKQNRMELK